AFCTACMAWMACAARANAFADCCATRAACCADAIVDVAALTVAFVPPAAATHPTHTAPAGVACTSRVSALAVASNILLRDEERRRALETSSVPWIPGQSRRNIGLPTDPLTHHI